MLYVLHGLAPCAARSFYRLVRSTRLHVLRGRANYNTGHVCITDSLDANDITR